MKKGRHRRFEEARDLKRAVSTEETTGEPCPECGAEPGKEHASWCLATEDDEFDDEDEEVAQDGAAQDVAARDGVGQDGVAEDGVARDGVAQDGVARDGVAEYDPSDSRQY